MRSFAVSALLLLSTALYAAPAKRAITHEDIWHLKRTGEPVVSPDGKWVAFSLTEPDYDPAKQVSDLWLVPADGSAAPRRLTSTRAAESSPTWAPDSKRIAFTTKRDGDEANQIYILAIDGGEAQRVTTIAGGASSPQFSPNGRALIFESDYDPIAGERKARKYNARVYDTFPIRFWNAWLDEKKPHVFMLELLEGAKPVDLLDKTKLAASRGFAGVFSPAGGQTLQAVWTPDGFSVVFTAYTNLDETMSAETESHLFVVPARGGAEPKRITEAGQSFSQPQFSPRGDALYALHTKNPVPGGRLYSLTRLAKFAWPSPGKATLLTDGWDRSVSDFSLTRDGATIYLGAEDDGFDQLFQISSGGGEVKRLFKVDRGGYTSPRPAAGGALIARFQTAAQPPEIVRVDAKGATHAMLTNFNAEKLNELDTPEAVHFWFTAKNGKKIHSIMNLPPGFSPAKKYPLVVFPHGGPNSMSKDAFSLRWNSHLLASPGFVLLQTNYTGSTGFGEKFADDIERDVLRGPAEEILEAVDEAGRRFPYVDTSRMAAAGASYGGYLMNWFEGNTDRFKCLVNHAGAINNESQYGTNDGGLDRELRMGGPIWERGGQWNSQSPIRYSGNFKTPMLITNGEQDFRVPMSESMTTFKILQRRHVPARLILFPDESHWILKGENSRFHMQQVLGWLREYLQTAKIALVGDSTVNDEGGWGTGFRAALSAEVGVKNHAMNGRSSKSFRDEGRWEPVLKEKPNCVLIQFGHNDQPGKGADRETDPATTYRANLIRYIDEARAAGAVPVLVTSIVRRNFDDAGKIKRDAMVPYVEEVRKIAAEKGVPLMDLYALTLAQCEQLGPARTAEFDAVDKDGKPDRTHLGAKGREAVGRLAAREFARAVPSMNPFLLP